MTRAPIRAAIAVIARAYRNGGVTNHIFTTRKEGDQP